MASVFTVLKQNNVAILGSSTNQIIFSEVFSELGDKLETTKISLKNSTGLVNFDTVFSKFNVNVTNSADATVFDADKVSATNIIDIYDGTAQAKADGVTDTVTIEANVLPDIEEDTYTLVVESFTNDDEPVSLGSQEIELKVVSINTALVKYETLIADMSSSDLEEIQAKKEELESAQQTANTAISALEDGETKTALTERYNVALAQQQEAFKLLNLYNSKNNHLTLFKINNVGGNVPFSIIFKDDVVLGTATEAFYYVPESAVPVPVTNIVPTQKNILFGGEGAVAGEYIYVFKINDIFYRSTIETEIVDEKLNIVKVDGLEIPVGSIDEAGESYTVPSEVVDKKALESLLASANADYVAHEIGTAPGNVPETQKTAFKTVIDEAQAIFDNADAQADEVQKAVANLTSAKEVFDGFIIKNHVDETALQTAVNEANVTIASATVGEEVGQTTQEAIDAYTSAIAIAQKVLDDTPSEVDYEDTEKFEELVQAVANALTALNEATAEYNSHVITNAKYAEAKLVIYENATKTFLESIRKKIHI